MSGDPLGLYDYRPGDGDNLILQKILRAAAALPAAIAAAGIPEAPIDGQPYARQNASWVVAAGGVSVIAGVVDVHADLPVTVGSPVVNAAYLVRDSSGTWLPFYDSRKPGGIWIRQFNLGNLDDWVYAGELQATQNAANFTVYDPTSPTKEMGFNPASVTAGARRILTPLDKNYTIEETGHKAKHENGGSDEISVAGLSGVLADPQPPIIGALATQAVAGNDARLSDARTPTAHKTSHENGGTDEISVAGLNGVLADPQPPIIGAGATQAVAGNDARLTDERVPTAAGLTTKFGTNKATLVDGDKVAILDSEAADAPRHGLWSLVKSTLKTYFDGIYQAAFSTLAATSGGTGQSTFAKGDILASPGSNTLNKITVGTDGHVLTADAASTNGVKWAASSGGGVARSSGFQFFDDFLTEAFVSNAPYVTDSSGAGAGRSTGWGSTLAPGYAIIDAGTTTTGYSSFTTSRNALCTSIGELTAECRVYLPALSDGTDEYQFWFGFGDTTNGFAQTDGAYMFYQRTGSVNWQMATANNTTRTTAASTVAVAATTWTTLKIVINAAGTSVAYYVNGTEVANSPITTNIPASNRFFGAITGIIKSAGTTSRVANIDYVYVSETLTSAR